MTTDEKIAEEWLISKTNTERINRIALSDAEYRIYLRCEIQVSDEHPIKCVCGRLATGLHECTCSKYRRTVDRLFIKIMRNLSKEHHK